MRALFRASQAGHDVSAVREWFSADPERELAISGLKILAHVVLPAALLVAMKRDADRPITELRVDGGACANNMLMQFQADLLGVPVVRPRTTETTALGAAYLAGIACGVYGSTAEVAGNWQVERVFEPQMSADEAAARMARWEKAVAALPPEEG